MIGYFSWHYTTALSTLLLIFRNLLFFLYHFFSIPQLFKTFFSPWKKEILRYEGPGFNLKIYFDVLIFNLFSKIIGAIVRTLTIFLFIFVSAIFILVSFLTLIIFLFIPFLSLPFYLAGQKEKAKISTQLFSDFLARRLEVNPQDYQQEKFDPKDIKQVSRWFERREKEKEFSCRFWELENLQKIKSLAKDWAFGYTVNLDKFCQDLNYEATLAPKLIGRKKEIEALERILSKRGENNVLLVGEPGVGRKTIILGLGQRITKGQTTPSLSHKRVLLFDLNSAVAEEKTIEEKRQKLLKLLKEAKDAGNIILAISSFDKFVSLGEGRLDLTQVFSQVIGFSNLQVIGLTTPDDYHRFLLPNQEIAKLFETVEVKPVSKEEALVILEDLVPAFEKDKKVFISFFAIREIVFKADVLVCEVPFPEKAINLLDEAVVFSVNNLKTGFLTKKIVNLLLSLKTKIPLTEMEKTEKEKLIHLEDFLHRRIIDQEEAVSAISKAMRRARTGLGSQNKPLGSFLFLGPTGVGKTETAKALSGLYFGQEKITRFDMAEFSGLFSVEKLIGNTEGQPGLLTSSVREAPFGVLLLDEFEKAGKEVQNLFLTVFDEGYLKDERGKTVSFANLIIIATSNAAAEFIREKVNEGLRGGELSEKLTEYVLTEKIFSPELINRLDAVIIFKPLSPIHLSQIAKLCLDKLNERLKNEYGITVKVTQEIIDKIAEFGFEPTMGARPMKRVIQEKIEEPIARMILEGKTKKGEEIEIEI